MMRKIIHKLISPLSTVESEAASPNNLHSPRSTTSNSSANLTTSTMNAITTTTATSTLTLNTDGSSTLQKSPRTRKSLEEELKEQWTKVKDAADVMIVDSTLESHGLPIKLQGRVIQLL